MVYLVVQVLQSNEDYCKALACWLNSVNLTISNWACRSNRWRMFARCADVNETTTSLCRSASVLPDVESVPTQVMSVCSEFEAVSLPTQRPAMITTINHSAFTAFTGVSIRGVHIIGTSIIRPVPKTKHSGLLEQFVIQAGWIPVTSYWKCQLQAVTSTRVNHSL